MLKRLKPRFRTRAKAVAIALAALPASQADAYPIDCAIFLCLAGGWPGSPDCTAAKTEFIRRVTPYPVEPPLQLWRCPMNASFVSSNLSPMQRLSAIKAGSSDPNPELPMENVPEPTILDVSVSSNSWPDAHSDLFLNPVPAPANVDLSSSDIDVVRSIKVWDVRHYNYQRRSRDGDCERSLDLVVGTYDANANFHWSDRAFTPTPPWLPLRNRCEPPSYFRGVGVEWTDTFGISDYELVRY